MMKPGKKINRSERIKAVEREFQVAEISIKALEQAMQKESGLLTNEGLNAADLRNFRTKLHDTYFIRMFAEFETGLRDFWKNGLNESPNTRVMDVITSIGVKRNIVDSFVTNVHAVRRWRNRLVHEEDADADQLEIRIARGYLGRYIGFLPDDW